MWYKYSAVRFCTWTWYFVQKNGKATFSIFSHQQKFEKKLEQNLCGKTNLDNSFFTAQGYVIIIISHPAQEFNHPAVGPTYLRNVIRAQRPTYKKPNNQL